jgi:hypothetical protein
MLAYKALPELPLIAARQQVEVVALRYGVERDAAADHAPIDFLGSYLRNRWIVRELPRHLVGQSHSASGLSRGAGRLRTAAPTLQI